MKYIFLFILIQLFLYGHALACSCGFGNCFCSSTVAIENDLIVSGEIVFVDSTKLELKIIDIFKGIEEKDTITIWAGTGYNCNGWISMATHLLGNKGDKIIIILPRIVSSNLENSWDVIGDYRRPDWLCDYPVLKLENDTVFGNIKDSGVARPWWSISKLSYTGFKNLWNNQTIDCIGLVGTDKHEIDNLDLCWDQDNLVIDNQGNRILNIDLYDPAGRKLRSLKSDSNQKIIIDLFMENHRFILVQISDNKKNMITKKVMR
jgi:hypothetical protein